MRAQRSVLKRLDFGWHPLDQIETMLGRFSSRGTLPIAVVSLSAIFGIFAFTLYAARLDVASAARTASSNLAMAVSQQLSRDIEILDLSLDDLVDGASNPAVSDLPPVIRRALLFDRAATGHGHGALLLIDATGHLTEQAGVGTVEPIDFSHEPFFRVHASIADAGLYVSRPFVSLVDGEATVALSRRINRNGLFAGVAVATIRLSYIQNFFRTLDLGPHGSATLVASDGTILVRQPFVAGAVGHSVDAISIRERLGDVAPGEFEMASTLDGVSRLFAYSYVRPYGITTFIGQSIDDIYVAWWRRAELTGIAMLMLGNVILVLIAALRVALGRREAAEAALATLARTDKLTGLANRRSFDEGLEREWERARADGQPLALLLLDIDYFKAFNDIFGHQGGDAVLASVAACVAKGTRRMGDLAARYGGEEFAVLLPNTTADEALVTARHIEALVRGLRQPHPDSPASILTVSIGAAAVTPTVHEPPDDLVRDADVSLYEAKRAGRNQIILRGAKLAA